MSALFWIGLGAALALAIAAWAMRRRSVRTPAATGLVEGATITLQVFTVTETDVDLAYECTATVAALTPIGPKLVADGRAYPVSWQSIRTDVLGRRVARYYQEAGQA
jgi:hypothetical protein